MATNDTTDRYRQLLHEGNLFLPVSESFRKQLVDLGCEQQKVIVHRSGIDLAMIEKARSVVDDEAHETSDVITVARFVEKKGVEFAIRAVASICRRISSLRYDIIGDGPLRPALERLTSSLGVADQIRFLGWMEHSQALRRMARARVFVLPSVTDQGGTQEGIPNALKEAMALGKPVVSTNHSGIPELVRDGTDGYLVPERDVRALANRIELLLCNDETAERMGKAAATRVAADYDANLLNHRLVQLYGELLEAQ